MDFANYRRRKTSTTHVGTLCIGSDYPIRIQTMANTSTNDIEGSIAQALRCREAGAELLRYTTQGLREVESLRQIHEALRARVGDSLPLVADVHFQADVADAAAQVVEKVRVNPGNYTVAFGASVDDIRCSAPFKLAKAQSWPVHNVLAPEVK